MRKLTEIILHCSDSPDRLDKIGASDIDRWHRERGWSQIGYHFVIKRDGTVENGRSIHIMGAHCKGRNRHSIGVCWIGQDEMTPVQRKSVDSLLWVLSRRYGIPHESVFGHTEINPHKTCPNIDMNLIRAELIFDKGEK